MDERKYNPEGHHRRSIRLPGTDYSQSGAYFVTLCTQNRACLFGEIRNGKMELNDAGQMVMKWYDELENKFSDITNDECFCMPNHFHFIVVNNGICNDNTGEHVGADLRVCPGNRGENVENTGEHTGSPLHRIVQWFKTMTTNEYIRGVKKQGWSPFPGKLWQRNYYEHVIRNDESLHRIREYIRNNPLQWETDHENPSIRTTK